MSHNTRPLLKLQLDQSSLGSILQNINNTLDQHYQMILDLQNRINVIPTRTELHTFKSQMLKDLDEKGEKLNERMNKFEEKVQKHLHDLDDSFSQSLLENTNMLNISIRRKFDEMTKQIPGLSIDDTKFDKEKMDLLEQRIVTAEANAELNRDFIQQIASSIGRFNNSKIELDNKLYDSLKPPIVSVNDNIKALQIEIQALKDQMNAQSQLIERKSIPELANYVQTAKQENASVDFDITAIRPYPSMVAHWRDVPELPQIHPFLSIGEVVDYVYRIVPKLQAHLNAMQSHMVDEAAEVANKVDKPLIEKMFEKFQGMIYSISKRISELKDGYDKTASRDEINSIVEELLKVMTKDSQTSVGQLKCMACGREIPLVTGSMTEEEADNSLGPATSQTVFHVKSAKVGVRYGDTSHFDSEIIEAPLSIRPAKVSKLANKPK